MFKLYTECWDDNPDNRPSTHDVVERLNLLINQKQDENLDEKLGEITNQTENKDTTLNSNNVEVSSHGELSKMIQDFDKMDVNQILNENITLNNVEESSRGELSRIVKDFDKMDTKEIMESMTTTSEEIINNKNISFENDLIIKLIKLQNLYLKY
ncbi:unnamed protein product [Rhizophagus irregularis]|nr:unnamed protein product [Rhizophagus irregularis]